MPAPIEEDGSRRPRGRGKHAAKRSGIVGYGHIGTQVGLLAESLGMQVFYYDTETKLALGNARPVSTLDALLAMADVVTLHVPETPQTAGMITAERLALMKQGSRLINASRGTVVDIDALVGALESKHLSGAAIDVFPTEPKTAAGPRRRPSPAGVPRRCHAGPRPRETRTATRSSDGRTARATPPRAARSTPPSKRRPGVEGRSPARNPPRSRPAGRCRTSAPVRHVRPNQRPGRRARPLGRPARRPPVRRSDDAGPRTPV